MIIPRYRRCSGFTLIEIIVTIAILGIVSTSIFSLFLYNTNVFKSSTGQSNAQSNARIAMDHITRETKYATDLSIISVTTCKNEILNKTLYNSIHYNYIYVDSGAISQAIYNNTTSQYTTKTILTSVVSTGIPFTKIGNSTLGISIVAKEGTKTFTIASSIVLINFALTTPTSTLQGGPDFAIRYSAPLTQSVLVSGIVVNSVSSSITTANGTMQMSTAISPSYATNQNVTWSVNDGSFATITSTGLLTARKTGTVMVTATASDGSGITGTKVITLSKQPVLVSSITVTGAHNSTTITTPNGTLQMSAAISPSIAVNKICAWSVSDTNIATIDSSGSLTAVGNGTVTVSGIANDISGVVGTLDITISNQVAKASPFKFICLGYTYNSGNTIIIPKNKTSDFTLTITPSNLGGTLTMIIENDDKFILTDNKNGSYTINSPSGKGKILKITFKLSTYDAAITFKTASGK